MGRELDLRAPSVEALAIFSLCRVLGVSWAKSKDGIYSHDDTVIPPCSGLPQYMSDCGMDGVDLLMLVLTMRTTGNSGTAQGSCLLG